MNNIWGDEDKIIINKSKKNMKIVFKNESEKQKITNIVMNASSVSNSKSLMDLVKDGVVDGSEPEPVVKEEVTPNVPAQETMTSLIERARDMGVRVTSEDSRAGILQKMKELESPKKVEENKEEVKIEEKKEPETTTVTSKKYKVLTEFGIQLSGSDETLEQNKEFEMDPESDEVKNLLSVDAIEEVI